MERQQIKKVCSVAIICLTTIAIFIPTAIFAQNDNYVLLTKLPGLAESLPQDNILGKYVPAVFKILIGLSAVFAVLMIVIGGFQYMSTDAIQGKTAGRDRIKNAIYGLVLVIAAWLILNEINPNLLKFNLNIDPVVTTGPEAGTGALGGGGGGKVASGADLLSGPSLTADGMVRSTLNNVGVNNPPCTESRRTNCTNLNGLPVTMVKSLQGLQTACASSNNGNCSVMITGATETSLHSKGTTHAPGNSVVDLSPTPELNKYLGKPNPKNDDSVEKDGLKFVYEVTGANGVSTENHWHVAK